MKSSTYQLTLDDAVQVWLRHWRGEYQHCIAASYGVNQGRICEVLKGKRHAGTESIAAAARKDH
jgi:hypothetical protein